MLDKIKNKIVRFSTVAGVEVCLGNDGRMSFYLVVLSQKKNVLSAEIQEGNVESIEQLKSRIPGNVPIALTINGRGVLLKKMSSSSGMSNVELISLVLPNAREADFYIQKSYSGKNLFVSLIRKDTFKKVLDLFVMHQLPLVYSGCGPFIVSSLIPFLAQDMEEINLSGTKLLLKNKLLIDYKPETENNNHILEVGEEKISSSFLVAYSSAFQIFLSSGYSDGIPSEQVQMLAADFRNKKLFKMGGYGALIFFIGLMLVNYLAYNYYKSENNSLSGKSNAYEGLVKEIEVLEKQIKEKEYFLQSAGWLSSAKTSYFADQIASTIPASIQLKDLKINPLNVKISKKEKKQIFQTDTIYVTGVCSSPTVLNPWMRRLRNESWIQEASNINYTHDPKTAKGSFIVAIKINDE